MKSYVITVNGSLYNVTVEETNEAAPAAVPSVASVAAPKKAA